MEKTTKNFKETNCPKWIKRQKNKKKGKKRPQPKTPEELLQRQKENKAAFMERLDKQAKRIEAAKLKKLEIEKMWKNI